MLSKKGDGHIRIGEFSALFAGAGRGLGSQMMARQYKGVPEYLCRYGIR